MGAISNSQKVINCAKNFNEILYLDKLSLPLKIFEQLIVDLNFLKDLASKEAERLDKEEISKAAIKKVTEDELNKKKNSKHC